MRYLCGFLCMFLFLAAGPAVADWVNMDIPTTLAPAGSAIEGPPGTWTIQAAGADIWGGSDEFHFLFEEEPFGPEAAISCRVVSLTGGTNAWAKLGIMFRAEGPDFLGPEPFAFGLVSRGNGLTLQYRDGNGVAAVRDAGLTPMAPSDVWLKFVRNNDTFDAYYAKTPPLWRLIHSQTVASLFDVDLHGGIALTSHEAGLLTEAVVDNINLEDPGIGMDGPENLACDIDDGTVTLTWENIGAYSGIQVFREDVDGIITAIEPGPEPNDESFADTPGEGLSIYHVVAMTVDGAPCLAVSCNAVVGGEGEMDPNGFIRSWLLVGPYDQAGGNAPGEGEIMRDYLADEDGMITEYNWLPADGDEVITDYGFLAASTGYQGGFFTGGNLLPKAQLHVDPDDTIDLAALAVAGNSEQVMAYAFAYINNPGDPIEGAIQVASDDSVQVSLGPCAVLVHNGGRGVGAAGTTQNSAAVTIPSGPSRIMVKVFQGGGGWGFRLRLVDADGNPITTETDPAISLAIDPAQVGLTELPDASCIRAVITPDPLTPACGQAPLTVSFDALQSFSLTGIELYTWDFGDGSPEEHEDMVTHTFEEPGFYVVSLTAEDEDGVSHTDSYTVNVFELEGEWECDPPGGPDESVMVHAFAFGNDTFTCETYNDEGVMYEKVSQATLGLLGVEYQPDRGWGYEVTRPGATSHNGWGIYGPFDDSPNTRSKFPDACPEQLYDQFIGCKNYTSTCPAPECPSVTGTDDPEGIHFIIDVPNGFYRFVGAFGDSDNVHTHTIMVENGGEGEAIDMSRTVVLVKDFNQAQWCHGETDAAELGEGVFARVGFDCKIPPLGDGIFPDPRFVNMDENGMPTFDPPASPVLEVTEGYIRMHQLQGVAVDGPGGVHDPNGADAVILEVWSVPDPTQGGTTLVNTGDVNIDGAINLADAISLLTHLFVTKGLPCMKSADANDDDKLDLGDAISILTYQFQNGSLTAPDGTELNSQGIGCIAYPDADVTALGCEQPCTQ